MSTSRRRGWGAAGVAARIGLATLAAAAATAGCVSAEPAGPSGASGDAGSPGSGGSGGGGGVGAGSGSGGNITTGGNGGTGGATGTGGGAGTGMSSVDGGSPGTGGAAGKGGATGAGGSAGSGGTGGATGTGGAPGTCVPIASTATRPQLASADAANFTIPKYLAGTDNWDPTAGLGSATSFTPNFTVAKDGSGTHTTVQAALTAASTGTARRFVLIKPGIYRETVSVSGTTPITIYGASTDAMQVTIVNGLDSAAAGGTGQSATLTSRANGFNIMNLTISNDFPTPATGTNIQAVALYTTGDKVVLQNVRLHGFQDTLFIDTTSAAAASRVYIKNSFIEGDTDFIFGGASAVIDGSTINYLSSRKGTGSGEHLAPSTRVANNFGFLVINCMFTSDATAPANRIYLGRSWDEGGITPTPNGQAVIRQSVLGNHIRKVDPWAPAATSARPFSATGNRFSEYCNSGPGAGI